MDKTIELARPAPAGAVIHYPESDGQPIGETDFHITVILYLRQALRYIFRRAEQTYVAANMLFYYEEGNPAAFRSPDVFVVKGISRHNRRVYKLWEEQAAPCAIFEITSRSTRLEDLGTKRALYEMLGVQEYFLFDPLDEYLSPQLQGFALVDNYYQPMKLLPDGTLHSQELGVILRPEGNFLRVVDAASGEAVPTLDEAVDQTFIEAERADAEAERADAEAERARIEAERARIEAERARIEAERADAEAEHARIEAERADAAEAEVARLRAELARLRGEIPAQE